MSNHTGKPMVILAVFISVLAGLRSASAMPIDEGQSLAASRGWLSRDAVARATVAGRTVASSEQRGNLWVVRLAPQGYVVLSGSDVCAPIVAFSGNEYVEPEVGSPFCDMLDHSDADALAAERSGGSRHIGWLRLLGDRDGRGLPLTTAAVTVDDSAVVVEPFLSSHWNQYQPYNDFSPVVSTPDAQGDSYRGRTPCGCVATAIAQVFAHWRWPWCGGVARTTSHGVDADGDGITDYRIGLRVDTHVPFDWDALEDKYALGYYDAHGSFAESRRYPVSRLLLWVDTLVSMRFAKGGSGAAPSVVGKNASDWYEVPTTVQIGDYPAFVAAALGDIAAGRPICVGVPGHEVVGHGWASDGEVDYLYLNYGWGGTSDGWYALDPTGQTGPVSDALCGLYAKRRPQVEPLPAVSSSGLTLKWHWPEAYADQVTGFQIATSRFGETASDWVEDFSNPVGTIGTVADGWITNRTDVGNSTPMLYFYGNRNNAYELGKRLQLTGTSAFSVRVRTRSVHAARLELQGCESDGEWKVLDSWSLVEADGLQTESWTTLFAFLGDRAGASVDLRLNLVCSDNWYYVGRIETLLLDDISLTGVIQPTAETIEVAADARRYEFSGLTGGALMNFTVTPLIAGGLPSAAVTTRVAGSSRLTVTGDDDWVVRDHAMGANDRRWSFSGTQTGTEIKTAKWRGGISFQANGGCVPTSSTQLSCDWKVSGYYEPGVTFDTLQVWYTPSGGDPVSVYCLTNESNRAQYSRLTVDLGDWADVPGVVNLKYTHLGNGQYSSGGMTFSNVTLSNVSEVNLAGGKTVTETFETMAAPAILRVCGADGYEADEGLYRDCSARGDVLYVECNDAVRELAAYPSHISDLPDEGVTVSRMSDGRFAVRFTPAADMPLRTRMILTLAAVNANGDVAYRDVILRFDAEERVMAIDNWRPFASLSGEASNVFTFDDTKTGRGTAAFSLSGLAGTYVDAPFGRAIEYDKNSSHYNSLTLDLPTKWTVLAVARSSTVNNGVIFALGSSRSGQSGLALASGGDGVVTLSAWTSLAAHTDLISATVANADTKYHAYAIRANGCEVELWVDGKRCGGGTLPALPSLGVQLFSACNGLYYTGLAYGTGAAVDDWRLYREWLSDEATAAYDQLLRQHDPAVGEIASGEGWNVPKKWFEGYYPGEGNYLARLNRMAANGRDTVRNCYVAGMDPTSATAEFRAQIRVEGDEVKVIGDPELPADEAALRRYRVLGSADLIHWSESNVAGPFFKLSVEMRR